MMRKWPTRARCVQRRLGKRARNPKDREYRVIFGRRPLHSTRAAAEVIERRGLGSLSYKTIARARVRLGLED